MENEEWLVGILDVVGEKITDAKLKDVYAQTDLALKARLVDSINRLNNTLTDIKDAKKMRGDGK